MGVPVRLLPLAALASCEAFRTLLVCVLAGRAARQSRRRWERWLPEILVPCRNRRGRRVAARRRRGVPDDSSVPGPRETARLREAARVRIQPARRCGNNRRYDATDARLR